MTNPIDDRIRNLVRDLAEEAPEMPEFDQLIATRDIQVDRDVPQSFDDHRRKRRPGGMILLAAAAVVAMLALLAGGIRLAGNDEVAIATDPEQGLPEQQTPVEGTAPVTESESETASASDTAEAVEVRYFLPGVVPEGAELSAAYTDPVDYFESSLDLVSDENPLRPIRIYTLRSNTPPPSIDPSATEVQPITVDGHDGQIWNSDTGVAAQWEIEDGLWGTVGGPVPELAIREVVDHLTVDVTVDPPTIELTGTPSGFSQARLDDHFVDLTYVLSNGEFLALSISEDSRIVTADHIREYFADEAEYELIEGAAGAGWALLNPASGAVDQYVWFGAGSIVRSGPPITTDEFRALAQSITEVTAAEWAEATADARTTR